MAALPIPFKLRNDPFQNALSNTSKLVFNRLIHFPSLPSTNVYLRQLAKRGEPEGLIILADEQTHGIGRLKRNWYSPSGGLYVSLLVRPLTITAQDTPLITLTTGLTIAKLFETAFGLKPSLKWPNDVLLNNQKVAGILVESSFIGDTIEYAVIGIGINVNTPLRNFPESLNETATTLFETLGCQVELPRLFEYLISQLEFWYLKLRDKGFKAIESHYRRLCTTLGKHVIIDMGEYQLTGLAIGLETDGSLVIQTTEGHQKIHSGDVVSSKSRNTIE
ncbi:MAG: biotin--[acetyl-CoA-carboxylase] ligase [Candidatus Thorarchaeota archaeon]